MHSHGTPCYSRLSPTQASTRDNDPKTWPYNVRSFARAAGNTGRWWSFMSDNEKAAFLDGYQTAMSQALSHSRDICKILKDNVKSSVDQAAFINQVATAINVCIAANDFVGRLLPPLPARRSLRTPQQYATLGTRQRLVQPHQRAVRPARAGSQRQTRSGYPTPRPAVKQIDVSQQGRQRRRSIASVITNPASEEGIDHLSHVL